MAIPFAMPRDEHPGMDLKQQLIRLLAIVSEIRMLLRLNTNNARDESAASIRAATRHGGGGPAARSPIISLSLDAGRVEMVVSATPDGATTVTTVTTTTTTTTTTNRNGDRDTNNERQPMDGIGDVAGAPRSDATANAKHAAGRRMAGKLQSLQSPAADEIVDDCGGDESDGGGGSDVPDSRPVNPPASAGPPPPRASTPAPPLSSTAPSTSSSLPLDSRSNTVTTVTTFITTRYIEPAPTVGTTSYNGNAASTGRTVLDKLSSVPSVSLVMVPFAVMVVWQWLKGR